MNTDPPPQYHQAIVAWSENASGVTAPLPPLRHKQIRQVTSRGLSVVYTKGSAEMVGGLLGKAATNWGFGKKLITSHHKGNKASTVRN